MPRQKTASKTSPKTKKTVKATKVSKVTKVKKAKSVKKPINRKLLTRLRKLHKRIFVGTAAVLLIVISTFAVYRNTQVTEAATNTTTVQAENMTFVPTNEASVNIDNGASGGKVVKTTVAVTGTITSTIRTTQEVRVTARGDQCSGAPNMQVKVDDTLLGNKAVSATGWTQYSFPVNLKPGSHKVEIGFTNPHTDYLKIFFWQLWPLCFRTLYVDKIDYVGPPIASPSPVPTSTATPTTTPSPTSTPSPTPTPSHSTTPSSTAAPLTLVNRPAQSAGIAYGSTANLAGYAHPGGFVIAGRDNYGDAAFRNVSAQGGTVLIYLDTVIDADGGRYATMLIKASECGAATSRWPGNIKANEWGYVNDFRVGSVLQKKLECVLEKMVTENPHMGGWFADDIGSRSWFPGFNWDSWTAANKQAYRDGAIELTKTFRRVADRHGLIFLVNGTWGAGSVAANGGGYPDMNKAGNALADGAMVEHHSGSEIGYFGPYACSSQWASQSPYTKGKAFMWSVTAASADRAAFVNSNCYSFVSTQADYGTAPSPWGPLHTTGLPSRVIR